MRRTHLVVDGSNIATEGRTAPSLAQLDEAVRAFLKQQEYEQTVVIVDATFGHRIDASEVASFEEAILAGEMVTPPAGTIGRGDAFILQVAKQADADVLSNDSFQELHAEHPWLFEAGRLWGGKPVPAVGWVFVARAPVRGVTSRKVVQAAKSAAKKAAAATLAAATATGGKSEARAKAEPKAAAKTSARGGRKAEAEPATRPDSEPAARPDAGADAVVDGRGEGGGRRRRRRGGGGGGGGGGDASSASSAGRGGRLPANEQLVYASFVVEHPIGSTVTGVVDRFSSHGAYVAFGSAVGYVPLKSLGDPPPRSAREILSIGEERAFSVTRFDPTTRGIDVVPIDVAASSTSAAPSGRGEAATASALVESPAPDAEEAPVSPVAKRPAKKKSAARKAVAKKKAVARKAPARKKAAAKRAPARKAAARKAPARKKAAAKRAPARKKAAAKRAPARKAPARKKAAAKRAPARKKAAAKRAPARKKAAAKRAPARKKAAARKAPARRTAAKKR